MFGRFAVGEMQGLGRSLSSCRRGESDTDWLMLKNGYKAAQKGSRKMAPEGNLAVKNDPIEIHARRIALTRDGLRQIAELAALVSRAKGENAIKLVNELEATLKTLGQADADFEAVSCWRCGASLTPPPAEVEVQIAMNERGAAWSGWQPDEFARRMRETMLPGDRIIGIGAAVTIRRADSSLIAVSKWSVRRVANPGQERPTLTRIK